jgi:hypothetical protein
MRRLGRFVLGAVLTVSLLAALPAEARGFCYRIQVFVRNELVLDRWVGVDCKYSSKPKSVVTQRAGEVVFRTLNY